VVSVAATHRLQSSNRISAVLERNLPGSDSLTGHQPHPTTSLPDQVQYSSGPLQLHSDWLSSAPNSHSLRESQILFIPEAEWSLQAAPSSCDFWMTSAAHNVSPEDLILQDSTLSLNPYPCDNKLPSTDDCNPYSQNGGLKASPTSNHQSGDCSTNGMPLGRSSI
jgi:hypothetical protein